MAEGPGPRIQQQQGERSGDGRDPRSGKRRCRRNRSNGLAIRLPPLRGVAKP